MFKIFKWNKKKSNKDANPAEVYGMHNLKDDIIGYPPSSAGIPIVQSRLLSSSVEKNIKLIRSQLAMNDDDFKKYIKPAINNVIGFLDLVPSSEYHHHAAGGGLLYHSLEVAKLSAESANMTHFPVGEGTLGDTQRSNINWVVGTTLAGLSHDTGKLFTDVEISNGEKGDKLSVWDPHSGDTINDWGRKNNFDRFYINWTKNRNLKHQNSSLLAMQRLIPQETWSWILRCFDGKQIYSEMLNAVACSRIEQHPMSKIISEADSTSVKNDMFSRNSHISKDKKRCSLSEMIVSLIKHYIITDKWAINRKDAPLWYVDDDFYVVWSVVAPDFIREIRKAGYGIPDSPRKLAQIMVDEGAAFDSGEDLLFDLYPEILGSTKKPARLRCLKMKSIAQVVFEPAKVYPIKEHAVKSHNNSLTEKIAESKEDNVQVKQDNLDHKLTKSALFESGRRQLTGNSLRKLEMHNFNSIGEKTPSSFPKRRKDNSGQELTCPVAKFISSNHEFGFVHGKVVIPSGKVNEVIETLLSSSIEGLTQVNAYSILLESEEIEIDK